MYASATAATDPNHVGYCSRLGLWKREADEEVEDEEADAAGTEPGSMAAASASKNRVRSLKLASKPPRLL